MLKGNIVIATFIMFIGSVVLALLLVYLLGNIGRTMIKGYFFYNAKVNTELLSGLISAASSFPGNFTIMYKLPEITCDLRIDENEVFMELLPGEYEIEGKNIKVTTGQKARVKIMRTSSIAITPIRETCEGGFLMIKKEENSISFGKVNEVMW